MEEILVREITIVQIARFIYLLPYRLHSFISTLSLPRIFPGNNPTEIPIAPIDFPSGPDMRAIVSRWFIFLWIGLPWKFQTKWWMYSDCDLLRAFVRQFHSNVRRKMMKDSSEADSWYENETSVNRLPSIFLFPVFRRSVLSHRMPSWA